MEQVLYGERRQPYVLWRAGALAVVLAGVLATGLTYAAVADVRGGSGRGTLGAPGGGVAVTAGAAAPAGCAEALARAEEALTEARAVDRVLTAQLALANEALAGRVRPEQALEQSLPELVRASRRSSALADADRRYRTAAQTCR